MRFWLCCCLLVLLPVLAHADECTPGLLNPPVDIKTVEGDPNFAYDQTTGDLGGKAQAGNSYKPTGVGGPRWHTAGLTQSNIHIKRQIDTHGFKRQDGSSACLFIDKISLNVELAPTVWVANEFPMGTCMYKVVREHEMRHVNADRTVTNQHLARIRAALTEVAMGRGFFGPASPDQIKAAADAFVAQVDAVLHRETEAYYADEAKAQQAIDTLQEYERLSHVCPKQMDGVH